MKKNYRVLSALPQPQTYYFTCRPKNPERPTNREIAEALSKMIVESGLIHCDGPQMLANSDHEEWRFTLYAYKKQEKLP